MTTRFEHACQVGHELHTHWQLGDSLSGFTAALGRGSPQLTAGIVRRFQRQMRALAGSRWLRRGHCAFAVDGTRIEAPHTAANEAGLQRAGRDKSAPQVFLTTLWHMGLELPWDFRVGPGTDSERRHLETMLASLPPESLVVADAGFCGYELCCKILKKGHSFLLRLGGNITLLSELGYHLEERQGLVYLWPEKFRHSPPMVLRLIVLSRGKQTIYLVTNLLDEQDLSDADAAELYELRWGVEVFYRSYKQTLDRQTLLSRTPATCLVESQWIMLSLWLLGLLSVSRQLADVRDPLGWSVARARDAVRSALRQPGRMRGARFCLGWQLRRAVRDPYVRLHSKAARNYPRKKRQKPPGPPKIKAATPLQIRRATKLGMIKPIAA